jgi:two-component system, OmpR family, response regulator ResD
MSIKTILIVDDEQHMRNLIRVYLTEAGYNLIESEDGVQALRILKTSDIDLILLDIMMPHMDGWTFCQEVRRLSDVPIFILTAKEETLDKVKGLKLGADDYLAKPFEEIELLARIEALFRRVTPNQSADIFVYKDLKIYKAERQVFYQNKLVHCTPKEYDLLEVLISNIGHVLTREQLLERVWGFDLDRDTRTVDSHMKNLRVKLRHDCNKADDLIHTIWGIGYKLGS